MTTSHYTLIYRVFEVLELWPPNLPCIIVAHPFVKRSKQPRGSQNSLLTLHHRQFLFCPLPKWLQVFEREVQATRRVWSRPLVDAEYYLVEELRENSLLAERRVADTESLNKH